MKLKHWLPFITIMFVFVMYNVIETNYFSRTTNLPESEMYPRTDTEVIADGICMLILAIALATLGIIQTLMHVVSWFSDVKITVTHVSKEEADGISKAAKDYQSTV